MPFRLHGTIVFSKARVLRVHSYHPARTAEGARTSIRYPTLKYVEHVVSSGVMSFHPFRVNDAVHSQTPILDSCLVSREFVERVV